MSNEYFFGGKHFLDRPMAGAGGGGRPQNTYATWEDT